MLLIPNQITFYAFLKKGKVCPQFSDMRSLIYTLSLPNNLVWLVHKPKSPELQIPSKMFQYMFLRFNLSWTYVYYDLIG